MKLGRPEEEFHELAVLVLAEDPRGDVLLLPFLCGIVLSWLGQDDHEGYGDIGPLRLELRAVVHLLLQDRDNKDMGDPRS